MSTIRTPPDRPAAGADEERATVIPEFDPDDFARDSEITQRAELTTGGEPTIARAYRLHLAGDHEDALFLVAQLLEIAPLHPEATSLSNQCRQALERQCLSALGSERGVLVVALSAEELKRFALDSVSGFLISLMDGATSVESILDISGLPRLLALRHLRRLFDRGIVAAAPSRRGR